jgi:crotonobetainyl-CoA:carnitine CoA-transferase CaiB-like acyl-CoA transferase
LEVTNSLLEGVRVIELGWVWVGPWIGAMLADMGAEVIKIETNLRTDGMRRLVPYAGGKPGLNRSVFNVINRNKKSCNLNLKSPRGMELFRDLVKVSDVVVENFGARIVASLGIRYDSLKEVNPDLIMVSLPGFGGTGPYKDYVSYASVVESVGGLTYTTGTAEEPAPSSVYPGDPTASLYGVICLLSALCYRSDTGKGQFIDISQAESIVTTVPEGMMDYVMNGRIRPRIGNRDNSMAPHGCYRCKGDDDWVTIAVSTDQEWKALCQAMGKPQLGAEAKFSDQFSRWRNQDELDKLISEWTKEHTAHEVMHTLQKMGIAAGPSYNAETLINDEHIKERGLFVEQNHPEAGKTFVYHSPWKMNGEYGEISVPAPLFGEHNSYVFEKLLGIPHDEFTKLVDEEVIY